MRLWARFTNPELRDVAIVAMMAVTLAAGLCAAEPPTTQPGETIANSIGLKLAYIPAAEFEMGSPPAEPGRETDEMRHAVRITHAFRIGVTEVTQSQWAAVMGPRKCAFEGENRPVDSVSWKEAVAFCEKLSEKEGCTYRLPTEAEWEYACRAGSTAPFNVTAQPNGAWVEDNSGDTTHEVGKCSPNGWGLYDMHGNVAEWCSDFYAPEFPKQKDDPTGPAEGKARVVRGGSYASFAAGCRSAARSSASESYSLKCIGFRVVFDLAPRPASSPAGIGANAAAVDFARDIQPILAANCLECHGPEKQRASLRLDARKAVYKGGVTGPTLQPGDSEHSLIMRRVRGLDDHKRMPLAADPLTDDQINALARWIDAGAPWPDALANDQALESGRHWAYVAPQRPNPPSVNDKNWVRNPIDSFIAARLEKENLKPAPEADKSTLLRRVYLDLIGLPPTPTETEQFLNDSAPDAYERLVDRLVASRHFGERWAQPWLDLARYADSNGYEKDRLRVVWPYRDWVINALNADMPFDEFTIEQLAGDLLEPSTLDQQVATGFNRNSMINEEGGVDPEETRCAVVIDRVNTTASVWLGSSIQCAQCHNHKFDPFSQKDYYQLFAFFNNTATEVKRMPDNDMVEDSPKLRVPWPDEARLLARKASLEKQIADAEPQFQLEQQQWEAQRSRPLVWQPLMPLRFESSGGATGELLADNSILAAGKSPDVDTYTADFETDLSPVSAVRLEVLPDARLGAGRGPGRTPHGNFVLSEFNLVTMSRAGGAANPIEWRNASADHSQFNGESYDIKLAIDGNPHTGWAVAPQYGVSHAAVFVPRRPIESAGGVRLHFTLDHQYGYQHTIGRFRISVTTDTGDVLRDSLPEKIRQTLTTAPADRSEAAGRELTEFFRAVSPLLRPERDELASINTKLESAPLTLVMKELPEPRETHIHLRGSFMNPGERVQPDVPGILPPLPPDAPRNRLGLAKWLVAPENPLTARVAVNRLWEQYFGRGLVATSADFGTQGKSPTHPELLDWLATELLRQGWHTKAIHRLIVTSATYRQSSRVTPDQIERDPENLLLAHAPRFRLDPERLRDQMLSVSGLLSPKIGGPSVMPYQIPGLWTAANSSDNRKWITSAGEDRWRRGLYTFWRRSLPYPSFVTFDATNRELMCARRARTNTPLQALTMLNDPECISAAAALALRTLSAPSHSPAERLAYGFRLCLQRDPRPAEANRLAALFDQMQSTYRSDAKAAAELAKVVPEATARPASIDDVDLAAWTVIWNVVLNTDEMLNRE